MDVLEKASSEGLGVRKVQARNMTIYTTSGQDKVSVVADLRSIHDHALGRLALLR